MIATAGELARRIYEGMRREASSVMIQRDWRMHVARKAYKELYSSAVSIQTGMRGMAARSELRFRRQTKAAIIIQVRQSLCCANIFLRCEYHTCYLKTSCMKLDYYAPLYSYMYIELIFLFHTLFSLSHMSIKLYILQIIIILFLYCRVNVANS